MAHSSSCKKLSIQALSSSCKKLSIQNFATKLVVSNFLVVSLKFGQKLPAPAVVGCAVVANECNACGEQWCAALRGEASAFMNMNVDKMVCGDRKAF